MYVFKYIYIYVYIRGDTWAVVLEPLGCVGSFLANEKATEVPLVFPSSLLLSSPELSDATVYAL